MKCLSHQGLVRRAFGTPCLLAVAVAALTPLGAGAEGFVEDTRLGLNLRNFYINRDLLDAPGGQNRAEEWTQSFILNLESGYTQGPVGFGVDALGMWAVKLDGGGGTYGTGLLPVHGAAGERHPADDFGRFAAAAKARVSDTELKVGEWIVVMPLLRSDDARSLPQTFQGGMITSREIDGLMLTLGQMRQNSTRDSASMEDMSYAGATSDRFNFIGGEYAFTPNTTVGLWAAELKDIYDQQYAQLIHVQPLGKDMALTANIGYFQGDEDGAARAGELDNRTWSGLFGFRFGGNTLYVGLQKVSGDTGWMRLNGTGGASLANDSFNNSYDNPGERSWQIRHDYNFAAVGVPGLSLVNRYISGENVELPGIDDGEEWGRETELAYTFQNGALKHLSLKWRNSSFRQDFGGRDLDENRIIINYPISLL